MMDFDEAFDDLVINAADTHAEEEGDNGNAALSFSEGASLLKPALKEAYEELTKISLNTYHCNDCGCHNSADKVLDAIESLLGGEA